MYRPHPIETEAVVLPDALAALTERLAEQVHETWAEARIAEGWTYGPVRDDRQKTTPCLVPYGALPEEEKDYDRRTATATLKLVLALGYRIEPV